MSDGLQCGLCLTVLNTENSGQVTADSSFCLECTHRLARRDYGGSEQGRGKTPPALKEGAD